MFLSSLDLVWRTWLICNTTNVESLVVREEGIALDLDGWELSLALTGSYGCKCGRCGAQKGDDDGGLHNWAVGRRRY